MRTVELIQLTDDNAEVVVAALEAAGIVWWVKQPGRFVRLLSAADWGVRIFVDADRLDEAQALARAALEP